MHILFSILLCVLWSLIHAYLHKRSRYYVVMTCNTNFFSAWNSAKTNDHMRFGNSQESAASNRFLYTDFYLHWKTATVNRHFPTPHTEVVHVRNNYSGQGCCWNNVYQTEVWEKKVRASGLPCTYQNFANTVFAGYHFKNTSRLPG